MKLKHFGMFLALGLLASCANDNQDGPRQPQDEGNAAYIQIAIAAGNSTRTQTGQQGKEEGQNYENTIYNFMVIFTDQDNKYVASEEVILPVAYEVKRDAPLKQVIKLSNSSNAIKNLTNGKVFVVCNYTTKPTLTPSTSIQQSLSLNTYGDTYWNKTNGYLMSSSEELALVSLTEISTDPSQPTDLGKVNVQRAMARFDVATAPLTSDNKVGKVKVEFDGVALVNISKEFYLFKQVDNKMLGSETVASVINDPQDQDKINLTGDHFLVKAGDSKPSSSLTFTEYEDIKAVDGDYTISPTVSKDYFIWTYCTPNTLSDPDKQKNGNSTGIVFRGRMTQENDGDVPGMKEGNKLWAFNGVLYGNAEAVFAAAKTPGGDYNNQLLQATLQTNDNIDLTKTDANAAGVKDANLANVSGLIGYSAELGKSDNSDAKNPKYYYAYYYYWNRHNDNGDKTNMGLMEFAVVRNNIYKLAVKKVTGLGLPGDKTPDPNEDDEIDDKTAENYFQVSVEVKEWDVRVNDIEF